MVISIATSAKEGWGKAGHEIAFGEVKFKPGGWIYGDADGVLYSDGEVG